MTTKEFISLVKIKAPRWERSGVNSILFITDQIQRELYSKSCKQTRYYDPETGFPPYLETQDKVLEYEIPDVTLKLNGTDYTARCFRVNRIFIDVAQFKDYNRRYLGPSFNFYPLNPMTRATDKLKFAPVRGNGWPAGDTTKARYVFMDNPGTSTDKYFIDFIIEPVKLLSESIPLTIPAAYHLNTLYKGVVGAIQMMDTGTSDLLEQYEEEYKPLFWDEMNQGAADDVPLTPPRF